MVTKLLDLINFSKGFTVGIFLTEKDMGKVPSYGIIMKNMKEGGKMG